MEERGYNGWTNYETWNWKLWIDNDQGSQEHWEEQARECYVEAEYSSGSSRVDDAVTELAERLQADAEENMPKVDGVWSDLLGAAVSEINWHEIAQAMVEDVKDDVDAEEAEQSEDTAD